MSRSELSPDERAFLASRRVARLATADAHGKPHCVPVCFACLEGGIYIALDEKPKRVDARRLRRVRNIIENPHVALVADRYSEDWSDLGFVSVRGRASLVELGEPEHSRAVAALRERYPQYREMRIDLRPVIWIAVEAVSSWGDIAPEPREPLGALDLVRGRHSVRWYDGREVPKDALRRILEAGRWAPSPHGRQPWRFVVLTNPDRRRELADAMAGEWQRQLEMDEQPSEVMEVRLRRSRERLMLAPVVVILCLYLEGMDRYPDAARQEAETTMAVQSLGAAAENMLLVAYALGLDGGWMCAPLFCPDLVREVLDLDHALIPHALLTFGYAAVHPPRKSKLTVDQLVVLHD